MKAPTLSAAIALLLALPSALFAQVGYDFLSAKPGAFNLWALRLHNPAEIGGDFDSMSPNTLTDVVNDFDAILVAGEPYVVELSGGVNDGRVLDIVSFSGDTITVAESLPVDTPVVYAIRRLPRLSERMGPDHITGFQQVADFNPDNGDLILLPAGGGLFDAYYHSSFPGHSGFFNADTGLPEDPLLRQTDAFFYLRRGAGDASVFMAGEIKETSTLVTLSDHFSYLSPASPAAKLGNISLELSLQSGTAETADIVWLQDSSNGGYKRYFHSDGSPPLGAGWREAGAAPGDEDIDRSEVWIDWGMIIQRRGPLPADILLVPEITP